MFFYFVALVVGTLAAQTSASGNLVCFYDSSSFVREGGGRMTLNDLEPSLQFCTHLVYGYAGINNDNFNLVSTHETLDIHRRHFAIITALKEQFPHLKVLLSVGGDIGSDNNKFIPLLEAGRQKQTAFIESARNLLRNYKFDGLDLALNLPRNKPRKVHGELGSVWKSFKKFFTGDFVVDEKANEHKEEITDLIADLRRAFIPDNLMLTLTVLPNVNSSWYYNAPAIINNLDFVNLAAFDFVTPGRNSEEADFTAPLYESNDQNRLPHYNVNFQVEYWLSQQVPRDKINLGIGIFGRAWKLTSDSGSSGVPVVGSTDGLAPKGPRSNKRGFLEWAEICAMLPNPSNIQRKGGEAPLRQVRDPTKRHGTYAYRPANDDNENGIWVSYEDPETAGIKAGYAKDKNLGGVALFDLSNDDFSGICTGDKYPMLRAIKYRLL